MISLIPPQLAALLIAIAGAPSFGAFYTLAVVIPH
jgi:hypothetical protein